MNYKRQIGLYNLQQATCKEYDPRAPEVARYVSSLIEQQLPTVTVEHIGSTSVPGCAGKGVVDLMVLYPLSQLESVKKLLEELGFQRQSTRDPFPEERPMRVGSVEYEGGVFQLHVHVISLDSPEVEVLRKFRDRLRTDKSLQDAYVASKREIIESGVTDTVDYSIAKEEFISQVLSLKQ